MLPLRVPERWATRSFALGPLGYAPDSQWHESTLSRDLDPLMDLGPYSYEGIQKRPRQRSYDVAAQSWSALT